MMLSAALYALACADWPRWSHLEQDSGPLYAAGETPAEATTWSQAASLAAGPDAEPVTLSPGEGLYFSPGIEGAGTSAADTGSADTGLALAAVAPAGDDTVSLELGVSLAWPGSSGGDSGACPDLPAVDGCGASCCSSPA